MSRVVSLLDTSSSWPHPEVEKTKDFTDFTHTFQIEGYQPKYLLSSVSSVGCKARRTANQYHRFKQRGNLHYQIRSKFIQYFCLRRTHYVLVGYIVGCHATDLLSTRGLYSKEMCCESHVLISSD